MISRRHIVSFGALAGLIFATSQYALAQENKVPEHKMQLFKVITIKDEIVIGLSSDEMTSVGGGGAGAVAHALAQKGDMTVWQYNVHRGVNGELVQSPTAKIGLSSTGRRLVMLMDDQLISLNIGQFSRRHIDRQDPWFD